MIGLFALQNLTRQITQIMKMETTHIYFHGYLNVDYEGLPAPFCPNLPTFQHVSLAERTFRREGNP